MFRRLIIASAFGAAAMYFLDPINGVQRRTNALQALDARMKQVNATLAGSGSRALMSSPPQALTTEADQGDTIATDRLAAAATSRAKTVKRASARTAKKTEQQA